MSLLPAPPRIVRTRYVGVHLAKPYVYVHREVKYPLADLGDIIDVVRDMIRGEKLRGVEAEGLLPCAVADELCGVGILKSLLSCGE